MLREYALNAYRRCCTSIHRKFWHPRYWMSADDRIRELCSFMATATGEELDAAMAELQTILRTSVNDIQNVTTYNLINFPSALEKRKKA